LRSILKACAAHDVAVEINANPYRLELDRRWHREAIGLGCLLSINPDAHSTSELDLVRWGAAIARKGGVTRDRVLNAMPLKQFEAYLRKRGGSAARFRPTNRRARAP
jgi:DNA polymerase (family 10)